MGNVVTSVRDYEKIYSDANHISSQTSSLMTAVSSEVMTVARMYVRLDDLDVRTLERPEVVKVLYIFADVVELRGTVVELPPSVKLVVLCRVLLLSSNQGMPTRVALLRGPYVPYDTNYSVELGLWSATPARPEDADRFFVHGQDALVLFTAAGDHKITALNEYSNLRNSESKVWPPRWVMEDPNILLGMEATMIISELLMGYMSHSKDMVTEVNLHVNWLRRLLHHTLIDVTATNAAANHELRSLYVRVQWLTSMAAAALKDAVIVPRLRHSAYGAYINRMGELARMYDADFKAVTLSIQQTESLGSYLLEQNKAFAEKEREMQVVYTTLNEVKMAELRQALGQLERLGGDMVEMSAAMDQARDDMEKGLIKFRNIQIARATFSLLNAIAQIGLAIFTGGATAGLAVSAVNNAGSAVNAATEAADQLRTIFQTVEKMLMLTEVLIALRDLLNAMNETGELGVVPPMPTDLPTNDEWAIFENEIEAVADGMPEEVSERLVWRAKCKNVAAIGREMVTQAQIVAQLEYDIKVHTLLLEVAQNHADRLEEIPTADLTDYQELAAQLDMRTTRILLNLMKVLSLQNGALIYGYLMLPTALNTTSISVTMSSVWSLLIQQEQATMVALGELGSPSHRIVDYIVKGIPVGLLDEGQDWDFSIPIEDSRHFPSTWSRVRISHLEMKFFKAGAAVEELVHQPSTDTGEVYITLRSDLFFQDRRKGQHLNYEAIMPVIYHFAYNLETGESTENNQPDQEFAHVFMRMTPFTRWKLRVSTAAKENQGLVFPTATTADATTQIAIRFYLSAIRDFDWNH